MAMFEEIGWLDAIAQADLVASGEVSSTELLDVSIDRIERLNPTLNAVIVEEFDRARQQASSLVPGGPLSGVPFLLKDFAAEWEGVPFVEGSWLPGDYVSPFDQELVIRYREAGLVMCGKTNTPEFAAGPTTEPQRFGPTRNPWDLERTPGGSSGGSAAAVASGMVPLAHGNDAGGSIRQPAACCGLFGLKPTRGRNPLGPRYGDIGSGVVAEHVLSRSVRDSAAALDASAQGGLGEPYLIPPPLRPYIDEVEAEPPRLRVALCLRPFIDVQVEEVCIEAARSVADLLDDLGHEVVEAAPDFDRDYHEQHLWAVYEALFAWIVMDWEERLGRQAADEELGPLIQDLRRRGRARDAGTYLRNVQGIQHVGRAIGKFQAVHDVILSPTTALPTPPLGAMGTRDGFGMVRQSLAFTCAANSGGFPAASLPLWWDRDGLPVGVQIMGRFGDESTLFRLSAQLERARPWADRHPLVSIDGL
jgi:amidase